MNLAEIQSIFLNRKFTDKTGTITWTFVAPDTLNIKSSDFTAIKYGIVERDGQFLLDHKNQLATEYLVIDVTERPYQYTVTLTKELSKTLFIELISLR